MLADSFAAVMVTRHPYREGMAVRYCGIWQPEPGKLLDFEPIEQEIYRLANNFSLVEVPYDSYQLAYMANRLRQNGVNAKEFNQQKPRLLADKNLQLSIVSRQMAHDGN